MPGGFKLRLQVLLVAAALGGLPFAVAAAQGAPQNA
jgi:hypothetical protein